MAVLKVLLEVLVGFWLLSVGVMAVLVAHAMLQPKPGFDLDRGRVDKAPHPGADRSAS
jgi:hypothetical protein